MSGMTVDAERRLGFRLRRGLRPMSLVLLSICWLAGCDGSTSSSAKLEAAIASNQVAGLFTPKTGLVAVAAPTCRSTTLAGDYTCTGRPTFAPCTAGEASPSVPCASPTAPTKVWLPCFPNPGRIAFSCRSVNAPAGTDVFVTAAQRSASKKAEWKCLKTTADGASIGPFTITTAKSYGPVETRPNYVTREQAVALARALGLPLAIVC
jgi:hypothetical protein